VNKKKSNENEINKKKIFQIIYFTKKKKIQIKYKYTQIKIYKNIFFNGKRVKSD